MSSTYDNQIKPQRVKKAVFPVGGMGTRFLPATLAIPKEMLPIVDKPLIQYAVEEAYEAGIRDMIFVTGRHKRAIEDHFDVAFELEAALERSNKTALLELVRNIKPDDMNCFYVRQPRPLGLGHAVLCAQHIVGNEPFAVLLADDLMVGEPPVMQQLVEAHLQHQASVVATQNVPPSQTNRYGIVDVCGSTDALAPISSLVEKPEPSQAPSTYAIAGRYVLSSRVFHYIRQQDQGAGGEIQLTDAIAAMLSEEAVYALRYEGRRYDCGNQAGFLEATVDLALAKADISEAFRQYLQQKTA
jgi:UTP--glucose-1-phosphate uridylyltransferase